MWQKARDLKAIRRMGLLVVVPSRLLQRVRLHLPKALISALTISHRGLGPRLYRPSLAEPLLRFGVDFIPSRTYHPKGAEEGAL
jgi:hypothetical protein